jgi:hypothetical protein
MKKLTYLSFVIWTLFGVQITFGQRVTWERTYDIHFGSELISQVILQDTGRIFCDVRSAKFTIFTARGNRTKPVIYSYNSQGSYLDSISVYDTTMGYLMCLNRTKKHFWFHYNVSNPPYNRTVFHRVNFRGFTLARRDFRLTEPQPDSMPTIFKKLIPAPDGGFYLLAARELTVANQAREHWQVSRWDSLANRRWVKEYVYNYAIGQPEHAEFLPNGNLFVSGYSGREIMGLEIDTANGRALERKLFYTFPNVTVGWQSGKATRTPQGYLIEGINYSRDSSTLLALVNDSLSMVWSEILPTNNKLDLIPMADSSFWYLRAQRRGSTTLNRMDYWYEKVDKNRNVIISINLNSDSNTVDRRIRSVAYISDGSAIFGGSVTTSSTVGSALYLLKIDRIGTPYNPVYPPVGPVLSSNQNVNQEPNLQVYPNPFTNTLRLSHKGTAQLLDVHGRVIISQPVEAGEELKVGNLPKGMYLLRLQSVGGKLYVRKVIKE